MQFLDTSIYRGPNVYALFPVIRHRVDLGVLEDWPTGKIGKEFVDALVDALPGLAEHGCSYREPGGLIRRMLEDEGTWLGHVLEHVVLELQEIAGYDVTFGKTRSTDEHGVYDMVFEYEEEFAGPRSQASLRWTCCTRCCPADLQPEDAPADFDFADERDHFHSRLSVPVSRAQYPLSGQGSGRARRIPGFVSMSTALFNLDTGATSSGCRPRSPASHAAYRGGAGIGERRNQPHTRRSRPAGSPPGACVSLTPRDCGGAAHWLSGGAQAAECEPRPRRHHRHQNEEQLEQAYDKAKEHSDGVIVETFLEGLDHRLLVVGGTPGRCRQARAGPRRGRWFTSSIEELVARSTKIPAAVSVTRKC
jgi:cyanophycin synthetase